LGDFDLDWWLPSLRPICEQFVQASRGNVNLQHWRSICKLREQYGGDIINGWISNLFPYLRSFIGGPCNRRNPIYETGEGFQSLVAPSGLSRVPFTWRNATTGRARQMEAVGGLLGVTQQHPTLALRPKVGWAVREASTLDALLNRLGREHTTFPGTRLEDAEYLPEDLCAFYHRTNGAELFGRSVFQIVAANDLEPLDWSELSDEQRGSSSPGGRIWHRFASLPDGSWLAINLDFNKNRAAWGQDPELSKKRDELGYEVFAPICHGSEATRNRPGANPVIALSFTELLEKLLDSGGKPWWLEPAFRGCGDAELFTRRG